VDARTGLGVLGKKRSLAHTGFKKSNHPATISTTLPRSEKAVTYLSAGTSRFRSFTDSPRGGTEARLDYPKRNELL
jgi:hypothetical protein